jgi:hypothetical protein
MDQKQHLQSIGHNGVFPPLPIPKSYYEYILIPPYIFLVDGIYPSFIFLNLCYIFHCYFNYLAIFFYFFYFFIYYGSLSNYYWTNCWAFYYFLDLNIPSIIFTGF